MEEDSNCPTDFPPNDFYAKTKSITKAQIDALSDLVSGDKSETDVDRYLRNNPSLLGACMNFTRFGNHGIWVIPQQQVRPPLTREQTGLKPDYIVGGKNSEGFLWMVVELKGINQPLFVQKRRRLALSSYANQGLCQLLEYIQYCNSAQNYLRESLHLTDFCNPRGLLLIGRQSELEEDPRKQKLRKQLNSAFSSQIEIRSYDALVRSNAFSQCDHE